MASFFSARGTQCSDVVPFGGGSSSLAHFQLVLFSVFSSAIWTLPVAQCALQDFNVDIRVDLQGGRVMDKPSGRCPAAIFVRDGVVDLSDIDSLMKAKRVPAGKEYKTVLVTVMSLNGYSFRDFLVALHNLSQQYQKHLAVVLFQQAPLRLCSFASTI